MVRRAKDHSWTVVGGHGNTVTTISSRLQAPRVFVMTCLACGNCTHRFSGTSVALVARHVMFPDEILSRGDGRQRERCVTMVSLSVQACTNGQLCGTQAIERGFWIPDGDCLGDKSLHELGKRRKSDKNTRQQGQLHPSKAETLPFPSVASSLGRSCLSRRIGKNAVCEV